MVLAEQQQLNFNCRWRRSRAPGLGDNHTLEPRVMEALGMIERESVRVPGKLRNMG